MMTSESKQHVHFIGIGGYGMSAIARIALDKGWRVTGSDVAHSELSRKLEARGATVYIGHDAAYVQGASLVVYSTAASADNPERQAGLALGIPVLHRAEFLARLMNDGLGVAVAGAHGKTTTSSMIALAMVECQLDPSYIIGGEIVGLGTNAAAGRGDYVVAEADESDGSFLNYFPHIAIVTNIEADHLENYDGDFANIKRAYVQFLSQVREDGKAIVCYDDHNVRELLATEENAVRIKADLITYGIDQAASQLTYRATNIELGDRRVRFTLHERGQQLGTVELNVPGQHNVYNAMATMATLLEAGVSFERAKLAIAKFVGAKRRFQVIGENNDKLVIDDYAHHPTEIEATLLAAKATGKRVIAVFQPQRYTRTYFLFDEFSKAFAHADEVYITDIYSPAGEQPIEGVSAQTLVERIRMNSNTNAHYVATKEQLEKRFSGALQPGELLITMGAGDIYKLAYALAPTL